MANLRRWSSSASGNATVTGGANAINFAEGQYPGTVNNSAREMMAQVRSVYKPSEWGWIEFSATVSVASQTSIKLPGDQTGDWTENRRWRLKGGSTTRYGVVVSASYTSETTVTVRVDSGSLSASHNIAGLSVISSEHRMPTTATVRIEDFGAIGDGVTDDTTAFNNFRTWAIAQGGAITLEMSPGKNYRCANPYWPTDIPVLKVNGNGSSIRNSATDNKDKMLLVPAYAHDKDGLGTFYNAIDRYLINTTSVGASTVTCTTPSEAGNLSAGEWIMLGSWDIQFSGYPANLRWFEYHEVVSANASTGVVTLRSPVKYAHQSDFPYTVYSYGDGRANIYKIEQGSLWNIQHEYNDLTFYENSVTNSAACVKAVYCTGRHITYNRCTARWFLPHVAETAILNSCVHTENAEFDKLVNNLIMNDNIIYDVVDSGTSINNFRAYRTRFTQGYQINSRNVELVDCDVQAASQSDVYLFASYNPVESLRIKGGTHEYLPNYTLQTNGVNYVQIGTDSVSWSAATSTLTVPIPSPLDYRSRFISRLFPGALIHTITSFAGGDYWGGNYGIVRSVTGDSSNCYAVIDWAATIAGTERLGSFGEPRYSDIQIEGVTRDYTLMAHTTFTRKNLLVTSAYSSLSIPICGRITRVIVDVKRAYTGATGGSINFNIKNGGSSAGSILSLAVDLKTVGRRERTTISSSGWSGSGGETAAGTLATGSFASNSFGLLNLTASTMASTNDSQLPIVDVIIELESPYNR